MRDVLCWATLPVLFPPDRFVPLRCVFELLKVVDDRRKVGAEDGVDGTDAETGTLVANGRAVVVRVERTHGSIAHIENTT